MPTNIVEYKVFIASPGGLDAERSAFKDSIEAHNSADGLARRIIFSPVGWEVVLRGMGRPQEKINEQVRESDYFILILWDRWGTPPDNGGPFTSGTEEEYNVALECLVSSSHHLKDIVVLFKTVDMRQLSDPGDQLKKVQEFRRKLEADKDVFYDTFDDLGSLKEKLRNYLSAWTRKHETAVPTLNRHDAHGGGVDEFDSMILRWESGANRSSAENSLLNDADTLQLSGKLIEAEAKLIEAVMPGNDPFAYNKYGHFLVKQGRLRDAEVTFDRMTKITRNANDPYWEAAALSGLGLVYRIRRNYFAAAEKLKEAYECKERADDRAGKIYVSTWQGDLHVQWRRYDEAKFFYSHALSLTSKDRPSQPLLNLLSKLEAAARKSKDLELADDVKAQLKHMKSSLEDMESIQRIKAAAAKLPRRGGGQVNTRRAT